jgi:6-phosphofructokinase 1
MKKRAKRIGILTAGGDCPGLNAVIRAVTKTAINDHHMEVVGIEDGYAGLIEGRYHDLDWMRVSGILHTGGTILGTSNRDNPFKYPVRDSRGDLMFMDVSDRAVENFKKMDLDVLVAVGGDGTMAITGKLLQKGIPVVGIPKTIDNDLAETDVTFGFDSAVAVATDALDRLHTTAQSHHRVMILETMGRYAGWIALYAGIAGGGDVILIPEIPYDMNKIYDRLEERSKQGKRFSLIVAAEGAKPEGGQYTVHRQVQESTDPIRLGGVGQKLADEIEDRIGVESRVTVLGHLQRGGSPTPYDRILGTRLGSKALELIDNNQFGKMVAVKGNEIVAVPMEDVAGKTRLIEADSEMIKVARSIGSIFGD